MSLSRNPVVNLEGQVIPVKSIYCVGRNFADHAKEMHNPVPAEPILFMKPATALVADGETIPFPDGETSLHYEGELVVLIGAELYHATEADAVKAVTGYAAGIDLTLRDRQNAAKKAGNPWLLCKGFTGSAPVGPFVRPERFADPARITWTFRQNGELRQTGSMGEMIFSPVQVLIYLSRWIRLVPGDLLFMGTPAGVGPVQSGDELACDLAGQSRVTVKIL